MNLTWHIFRKDLVRFRLILLAWVLCLAGKYLLFAVISGVFGHPNVAALNYFQFMSPFFFAAIVGPAAIAYFLVAAVVFEDPPAGRDPFWVTRPISGVRLFTAKLLFTVMMFVVVPLLAALPWWLACGFSLAEIASQVGYMGSAYLVTVLAGMAVASATDGYPRYFVWTLAGLAVVLAAHVIPAVSGRHNDLPVAFYLWMLGTGIAVLSLVIVGHRFVVRHFGKCLPLAAVLVLLGSVWLYNWPPAALARVASPAPATLPDETAVRVVVAGDVRSFLKGGLSLPLRVDGLPDNAVPVLWMDAKWRAPDGKTWLVKGSSGGNLQPLRRAVRRMLRLTGDETRDLVQSVNFTLAPKYADRIANDAASVEGKVRIYASRAELLSEAPVGPDTRRFAGGSFTVSEYLATPGDVSFLYTIRSPHSYERWHGIGYVALLNRRTGEIIEPAMQQLRTGMWPFFNDVAVISVWLRFKLPDSQWLSDANLVVVGLGNGYELNAVVPAYVRPADHAAALQPKPFSMSPETLRDYMGIYQPRPGAKLVIKEFHGNLALEDSGFIRAGLLPESRDHFFAPHQDWIFISREGYHVEFVRNAAGRVTHFVVHQDGRDFIVPRLPDKS